MSNASKYNAAEVEEKLTSVFNIISTRLQAIPARVAARIGAAKTNVDRKKIIQKPILQALEELSKIKINSRRSFKIRAHQYFNGVGPSFNRVTN